MTAGHARPTVLEASRLAQDLRAAFDRSFAAAPPAPGEETVDLLAVRIAGGAYALDLGELAGCEAARTALPLPGATPELLGLAGVRGRLVAVYSLTALLGRGAAADDSSLWAISRAEGQLALAAGALESYLRLPRSRVRSGEREGAGRFVRRYVEDGALVRGVIDLGAVVEHIKKGREP